jgi:Spy/CpxP family protein refolding chaperone
MGYYTKENIDFQLKEAIKEATRELGIQDISNSIRKVLTPEQINQLIELLKNGTK